MNSDSKPLAMCNACHNLSVVDRSGFCPLCSKHLFRIARALDNTSKENQKQFAIYLRKSITIHNWL